MAKIENSIEFGLCHLEYLVGDAKIFFSHALLPIVF